MKARGQPAVGEFFALNRRPLVRSLLASAAIVAAVALAGCDTDGAAPTMRSLQPLSAQMVGEIEQRNMAKESPILVRIFKEEAELEVWKEDSSGRMALLKTYPVCRWSGELGPKLKQGYDHFEVTRLEPKVDVCDKSYVFDAETNGKFSAAGKCPAYRVNEDLVAAVK